MIKLIKEKGTDNFYATGDTYEHRDELRRAGWMWEPRMKAWRTCLVEPIEATIDLFTSVKPGTVKALRNLGIHYVATTDEVVKTEAPAPAADEKKEESPSIAVKQMWEGLLGKPSTNEETQFIKIDKAQSGINPTCWIDGIEIHNMTDVSGETDFGYNFHYRTKFGEKLDDMIICGFESPGAAKAKAFSRIESAFKTASSLGREAVIQRQNDGLSTPVTDFSPKGLGY